MNAFAWMAQQITPPAKRVTIERRTSMSAKTAENLARLLEHDGPWMHGEIRRLLDADHADVQCVLRLGEGRGLLRRERHFKGQWVWHKC